MPTYFEGFPVAGQTAHFLVTYADAGDLDALYRAQAIVGTCEADLATLEVWFGCVFSPPYAVWVHVDHGSAGAGAENWGYDSSGSSRIVIWGTFGPVTVPTPTASEVARMLFVAEFAEILMSYTTYGWQAGNSAGEALSRVAAAELHPDGYYAPHYGPYVNAWLNLDPRPDWVATSAGSDTDMPSFGGGIVFLYFLANQLGFSWADIVTAGGSSLAATFATLTGTAESDAFAGLEGVLEPRLPAGTALTVPRDNFFPLLEPAQRSVWFPETAVVPVSSNVESEVFAVDLEVCPGNPKTYTYRVEDLGVQLNVTARVRGCMLGAFSWSIGGVALPGGSPQAVSAAIPVTVTETTPAEDEQPVAAMLPIRYVVADGHNASTLEIRNDASPGTTDVAITVAVHEAHLADADVSATTDVELPLRGFDMEPDYWTDLYRCRQHPIVELATAVAALSDQVLILRTTPDPAPEAVAALAALATTYLRALAAATGGKAGLRPGLAELTRRARSTLAVPAASRAPAVAGGLPILAYGVPATDAPTPAPRAW